MSCTNIIGKFVFLLQVKYLIKQTGKKTRRKEARATSSLNSSFFTKVTECFSGYFDLISTLSGALKCPHRLWKPGGQV